MYIGETGIVRVGEKAGTGSQIIRLSKLLGEGLMGKPVANPQNGGCRNVYESNGFLDFRWCRL